MSTTFYSNLRESLTKGKIKVDKKLLMFLFFVIVATIFWFLSALSKDYTTEFTYPVQYKNFPKDKIVVGELPENLKLKVNGYGFILLKYKFQMNVVPVSIDVSSLNLRRIPGSRNNEYYVLSDFAKEEIAQHLGNELKIIDIEPDSLIFRFSSIISRKMKIIPQINYSVEKQYMLDGRVTSDPDSILVSGPKSILDTIKGVRTNILDIGKINKTTKRNISLVQLDDLKFDVKRVVVEVPVQQFTEAQLKIPIKAINVPDSLRISTFPSSVTVSCNVGLKEFNVLKDKDFRAVVDYKDIDVNISNKLKVRIDTYPAYVFNIGFKPMSVEYIIEKL